MAGAVALRNRPTPPDSADPAEVRPRRSLAEIRAAGLVRHASEQVELGVERVLPVAAELRGLLPGGHLRRGTTVVVAPGVAVTPGVAVAPRVAVTSGSTSLLFTLLATASAAGSWCAAVGMPHLGLAAAAEAGVAVERFALVPHPGPEWTSVVAALLDGVDLVVVAAPPGAVSAQVAARLTARARQRGGVLIPVGAWPGTDLTLEVVGGAWQGLGNGRGRLRQRQVEVISYGRGAATRTRRARLWLPGPGPARAKASAKISGLAGVVQMPTTIPARDTHDPEIHQLGLAG